MRIKNIDCKNINILQIQVHIELVYKDKCQQDNKVSNNPDDVDKNETRTSAEEETNDNKVSERTIRRIVHDCVKDKKQV